jgi:hypothetical protein
MPVLAPMAVGAGRPINVNATCSKYGTRPMGMEVPMAAGDP